MILPGGRGGGEAVMRLGGRVARGCPLAGRVRVGQQELGPAVVNKGGRVSDCGEEEAADVAAVMCWREGTDGGKVVSLTRITAAYAQGHLH